MNINNGIISNNYNMVQSKQKGHGDTAKGYEPYANAKHSLNEVGYTPKPVTSGYDSYGANMAQVGKEPLILVHSTVLFQNEHFAFMVPHRKSPNIITNGSEQAMRSFQIWNKSTGERMFFDNIEEPKRFITELLSQLEKNSVGLQSFLDELVKGNGEGLRDTSLYSFFQHMVENMSDRNIPFEVEDGHKEG